MKRGRFEIAARTMEDGSIDVPSHKAQSTLCQMLKKQGNTEAEVDAALRRYHQASLDTPTQIAPNLSAINSYIDGIEPTLDGRLMLTKMHEGREVLHGAGIVLLKIAYEFLALLLEDSIFECHFDSIRKAIRENDQTLCDFEVESGFSRHARPFHGIALRRSSRIVIQIRLLGTSGWDLTFPNLPRSDCLPCIAYTHFLDSGEEIRQEI